MRVQSRFNVVDRNREHNILFIEDNFDGQVGLKTVTNDAENVVTYFRALYGNGIRIVYRDTDMQWWEIVWTLDLNGTHVSFKPWAGLAWDLLQRTKA